MNFLEFFFRFPERAQTFAANSEEDFTEKTPNITINKWNNTITLQTISTINGPIELIKTQAKENDKIL